MTIGKKAVPLPLTSEQTNALALLKTGLQSGLPCALEKLSAELISRLLELPIYVASSGYQFGADAGAVGHYDRTLRIECKRYADKRRLDERFLKGELLEAGEKDDQLELWALFTTQTADWKLRKSLSDAGAMLGIPVLIFDWTGGRAGIPDLAALCAWAHDLVAAHYPKAIVTAAKKLQALGAAAVAGIRTDLQVWKVGLDALRADATRRLEQIWTVSKDAYAYMGQDAAGGFQQLQLLRRGSIANDLEQWNKAPTDTPAVVVGLDGVGKTWATLHWLVEHRDELPIVLTLPASAFAQIPPTDTGLSQLLADRLFSLTNVRDAAYWGYRLKRLLQRPKDTGPVMVLFVDGLNQTPSYPWKEALQTLQGDRFERLIRVVVSMRTTFFEENLDHLRKIAVKPLRIDVHVYDDGELEQMLGKFGCSRNDLHEKLVDLARVPRLLPLVVRLKGSPELQSDATVHRLLWEYGKDVLAKRHGNPFSESDWRQWLVERANEYRALLVSGRAVVESFTRAQIADSTAHAGIGPDEVARRLNEIIDGGHWVEKVPGTANSFRLKKSTATLALAVSLLSHLEEVAASDEKAVESAFSARMDPIAAIDETADVARAAATVLAVAGNADGQVVANTVVTHWLQSQNMGTSIETDIAAIAPALPVTLLNALERSSGGAHASSREIAIHGLRSIPLSRDSAWKAIVDRLISWMCQLHCPSAEDLPKEDDHYAKREGERLTQRIGSAEPGTYTVLGVPLVLSRESEKDLSAMVPRLLEGFPLLRAKAVLAACAVAETVNVDVRRDSWQGMRWLSLLNEVDPDAARQNLREMAEAVLHVEQEAYVNPNLRQAVSSRLLWLAGTESDETKAYAIDPGLERRWDYEKDYARSPSRSIFEVERRHAGQALEDSAVHLMRRLQNVRRYISDPSLEAPPRLHEDLQRFAADFPVERLDQHGQRTAEDLNFEETEPALGRYLPAALASLVRRRMACIDSKGPEARYWAAIGTRDFLLLATPKHCQAASVLRRSSTEQDVSHECITSSYLAELEILHQSGVHQLETLLDARNAYLTIDLVRGLGPLTIDDLRVFLRDRQADSRALTIVLSYIAENQGPIDDDMIAALMPHLRDQNAELRTAAMVGLARAAPVALGKYLLHIAWKPDLADVVASHYGGAAVIAAAEESFAFADLLLRIPPWRYLEAAVSRGARPEEVLEAANAVSSIVLARGAILADLKANVTVTTHTEGELPRYSVEARGDESQNLEDAFDFEKQVQAQRKIADQTTDSIDAIRQSGALLFLQSIPPAGLEAAWRHARQVVWLWLEGLDEGSGILVDRMLHAEGLYLSLCEVLLNDAPDTGAKLWQLLRKHMRTSFPGAAGVSRLVHMLFQAKDSPPLQALREELLRLSNYTSDAQLLDVVLAALFNGDERWLHVYISKEDASGQAWREKRALILKALVAEPALDSLVWPEGKAVGTWEGLRRQMLYWSNRGILAKHWWERFVQSTSPEYAYATWTVMLTCVDRRLWVEISRYLRTPPATDRFGRMKWLHVIRNRSALERAMKQNEEKPSNFADNLMGWPMPKKWLTLKGR